jgi:hypothetical protein
VRRILYVDGFNFYYGVTAHWRKNDLAGLGWCDFRALIERHFPEEGELCVKYFTAVVREQTPQRWEGEFERYALWRRAVQTIPGAVVIEGFYKRDTSRSRPDADTKFREEKQTDVNLAVELLTDAFGLSGPRPDRVYLLSGDCDLMPAVFALEERVGIPVTMLLPSESRKEDWERTYGRTRKGLRRIHFPYKGVKTFEFPIPPIIVLDEEMLANSLFSYSLRDSEGDFECPHYWQLDAAYLKEHCRKREWRPDVRRP